MKSLAKLFLLLVFLPGVATAQDAIGETEYVEFIRFIDENGNSTCRQFSRSAEEMRALEEAKAKLGMVVLPNTIGRRAQGQGLDIVLRATPQMLQFPAAVTAFEVAAQRFENFIANPITVVMDVDYGPTRFGQPYGPGVLGSTSAAIVSLSGYAVRRFADSLKARAPGYGAIYDAIPQPVPNTAGAANPLPSGTTPNLQALGILNANGNQLSAVPSIGFNSNFPFDLDPTNGISAGQTDFDAVAVHEIGHALGFVSVIGGNTNFLRTWDFFRFRPGAVTNLQTFATATRVNTPGPSPNGGDQVFWDGEREWEVSTARGDRTGGDGQQASHWRDDAQRLHVPLPERKIGIMDPNLAAGVRDTLKFADWKALGIMGWQVTKVEEVKNVRLSSDFQTPTSVALQWTNPSLTVGGGAIGNLEILVFRNGQLIRAFSNAQPGATLSLLDTGLTQYSTQTYLIYAHNPGVEDSGFPVARTVTVGGSPRPAEATDFSARSNGSTAVLRITAPTRHDDGTILHNLSAMLLYRNAPQPSNLFLSVPLSPTDTGRTFVVADTPPRRAVPNYAYNVVFVGSAPPNVNGEGPARSSPTVRAGVVQNANYFETFETSRQSVIEDFAWDSTNALAYQGSWSFAALNYGANLNASAYIPQTRLLTNGELRFWTICRAGVGDTGFVEISRNRGATWSPVLSLTRNSRPEWANGQNVWFEQSVSLSAFNLDTVVARFRLQSGQNGGGFGWLIDNVALTQGTLSANDRANKPFEFALEQNYPNPFNPATTIQYELGETSDVKLRVFDVLGRDIATLIDARQSAGRYRVEFNASALSSGVYFYRLETPSFSQTRKMVLAK
ncbi:MAG: NF038122 family metalloprotease [Chloroherpetonaceae bacterium]|nr:NF038122 family metalloprotease [Chloroherpetonaceae bacterium]MDW8436981.1 NF038122 family metalloprotease [Chloroherpetonaceae bacterium]